MGKIITVPIELVKPTQFYLGEGILKDVLKLYHTPSRKVIPAPPVKLVDDEYLLIDGHHRMAVCKYLEYERVNLYLTTSSNDKIDPAEHPRFLQEMIADSNNLIERRFTELEDDRRSCKVNRIITLEDLWGYSKLDKIKKELKLK